MFRLLSLLITSCVLSACAGKFTLIDRSDGVIYNGSTDSSTVGGTGNATLNIEGESYTGPWIYQASGGSYSFANFAGTTTFSGAARTVTPSGAEYSSNLSGSANTNSSATAFNVSATGNGMINARATSGKFVRCIFTFNTLNNTGVGECLRNDGRTYDLHVKR